MLIKIRSFIVLCYVTCALTNVKKYNFFFLSFTKFCPFLLPFPLSFYLSQQNIADDYILLSDEKCHKAEVLIVWKFSI